MQTQITNKKLLNFSVIFIALLAIQSAFAVPVIPSSAGGAARQLRDQYSNPQNMNNDFYNRSRMSTPNNMISVGSTVPSLPSGCKKIQHKGENLYRCGSRFYRPQGKGFVVITPPK